MSILDMFRSPAPAAVPTPVQPGNLPAAGRVNPDGTPAAATNGIVPAASAAPVDSSPLEQFKDLWDTAPVDPNKKAEPTSFTLDPKEVAEIVNKHDFSKAASPEALAAVAAGGEPAVAAMLEIINNLGRQVLTQSTLVGNQLSGQITDRALAAYGTKLPDMIRNQNTANHVKGVNPIMNNPAIQPVIDAARQQLLQKFPNASDAEVGTMLTQYVEAMGAQFAPKTAAQQAVGQNWEKFLA